LMRSNSSRLNKRKPTTDGQAADPKINTYWRGLLHRIYTTQTVLSSAGCRNPLLLAGHRTGAGWRCRRRFRRIQGLRGLRTPGCGETTFFFFLPRWRSRVRISSTAPRRTGSSGRFSAFSGRSAVRVGEHGPARLPMVCPCFAHVVAEACDGYRVDPPAVCRVLGAAGLPRGSIRPRTAPGTPPARSAVHVESRNERCGS